MGDKDCIFCKIIDGEIPSTTVFEDDCCVAFNDLSPQAPTHVLIVPRSHIDSLDAAIAAEHAALLGGRLRARNRDGGGLAIELALPVTRSLPDGDGTATRDGEPEPR